MAPPTPVSIGRNFGWLHHANGDRGVVMCAAIGYEALCAHQSWRVLADRLAAAGLPTLRFDYPGEGDSLDDHDGSCPFESWRRSIKESINWMRETLGVSEIVVVGFRLGATLAAEAGGAQFLVQLAPIVKGSIYLRELRMLSRMLASNEPNSRETVASATGIDLEGFAINNATLAAINEIELTDLSIRPAPRILIMANSFARGVEQYAARLLQMGATVDTMTLEAYDALTPSPTPKPLPSNDFRAIVDWASAGARPRGIPEPPIGVLRGETFAERGVRFGENGELAGVLCEPKREARKSLALLLNTGANYHIGSGRSFVDCARSLAEKGIATLRMDSLGVGDSTPVEQGAYSVLYREARHADVFRALDWASEQGFTDFHLVGVCSGATLALLSAAKNSRVSGVVLANIQVFVNLRDDAVIEARLKIALGSTSTYLAKAMSLRSWARVLTKDIAISKLAAIVAGVLRRNGAAIWSGLTAGLGSQNPGSRTAREAYANFEALSRRGARVVVLHGEADAGLEELAINFGPGARRVRVLPGVRLETIPSLDHAFSSMRARELLTNEIVALIGGTSGARAVSLPSTQSTTELSMSSCSPGLTHADAVVCVPTFRRPDMLRATLESLVAQRTNISFAVVVIDNDADARTGSRSGSRVL